MGTAVGAAVGAAVGLAVGAAVGAAVGFAVGAGVGLAALPEGLLLEVWELLGFAVAAGFVFVLSRLCVHPTLVNPSGASRLFGLETLAEVPLDSMVTKRLYQNSINGAAYRLINAFHGMQAVLLMD